MPVPVPTTRPPQLPALADPARLDALRRTDLLDTPPDAVLDRYTRLVGRIVGVPVALLSLVDDERQFFKSAQGLGEPWATLRQTPLSHSFCQYVVADDAPLAVADARLDVRLADNAAIDELGVTAYLGAPVHGPAGEAIGSLCAIDHAPRQWSEDDVALLTELAGVTSELIAMRTAAAERRAAVVDVSHRLRTGLTALCLQAEELAAEADASARPGAAALVTGLQAQSAALDAALAHMAGLSTGQECLLDLDVVASAVAAGASTPARRIQVVSVASGDAKVRASAADTRRVLEDVVRVLLEHGTGDIALSVLPSARTVRVRLQDQGDGLPPVVVQDLVGRADGSGHSTTLGERVARTLRGRLVLVANGPATVDVLLPREASALHRSAPEASFGDV